jgi:hypothetical protein
METKSKILQILFVISLLSLLALNNCSSGTQTTTERSESEEQESETTIEKSAFVKVPFERASQQSGHFFTYRFRTSDDRIYDIDEFLNNLASEGFDIISAWYFAGPNCGSSKTIYHPQLIVQLSTRDLRLNNFNFVYTTDRIIFKCTENTDRYIQKK